MRIDNFSALRRAGFTEENVAVVPSSVWWVNQQSRIFFEFAAARDADGVWLAECIREDVRDGVGVFYFALGSQYDVIVCDKILEQFRLLNLRAEIRSVLPALINGRMVA
jgi:hypothetical protein